VSEEKHEGLPVPGYVAQPNANVALVTMNKLIEELVLRRLDALATTPGIDGRWLAIGRTAIENGFMAVNRSVFKPERLKDLDEEILNKLLSGSN
jgi:hypothetical protein